MALSDDLTSIRASQLELLADSVEVLTFTSTTDRLGTEIGRTPVVLRTLPGRIAPPKANRPWEAGRQVTEREWTITLAWDADISGALAYRKAGTAVLRYPTGDNVDSTLRTVTIVTATTADLLTGVA